eukprot:scaffold1501_cov130-Cylindrotheca_fusiformis.AAC.8
MISKIPAFLFTTALFGAHEAFAFTPMTSNDSRPSTSLKYAETEALADPARLESFRNSIIRTYEREEPQVTSSQLLTEQLSREFTTGRRYLLAASAIKELSEEFYDAEEQQRYRAIGLIEFARNSGIKLSDYASKVDKSPIDTSLSKEDFLKELILQEKQDVKVLNQAMAKAASNQDLVAYLQTIRSEHVDRQKNLMKALSASFDVDSTLSTVDSTATEKTSRFSEELVRKVDMNDSVQSIARWYENQLQGLGRNLEIMISRAGHISATGAATAVGATAATAAVVDSNPELLDSIPINPEDFLQVMDGASNLLEEPGMLVDTIQQSIVETGTLAQLVDVVAGLY